MEKKSYTAGFGILSVAFIICAVIIGMSLRGVRGGYTITVTGSARKPITSDFVVWRGSLSAQNKTMSQTYRDLKKTVERVQQYFRTNSIPDSNITWQSITSYPIPDVAANGHETGRVNGYHIDQQFEIRSFDIKKIEEVSNHISELILEDVPVQSFPIEYSVTKLNEYRLDMLSEATKDAKLRAGKIAEGAGNKIGAIRNARVGVFQITKRNSTEVSDAGMYDTSSKEKEMMAVVSVSFAID